MRFPYYFADRLLCKILREKIQMGLQESMKVRVFLVSAIKHIWNSSMVPLPTKRSLHWLSESADL